jgi:hypothetical protein
VKVARTYGSSGAYTGVMAYVSLEDGANYNFYSVKLKGDSVPRISTSQSDIAWWVPPVIVQGALYNSLDGLLVKIQ